MISACPTAPDALCGLLMLQLAWCRAHSAVNGDRTFAAAGYHLWNSLPLQLHDLDNG